ncbi:MAG: alpha/beta fold hydrolase [Bacteroidota bacterium]
MSLESHSDKRSQHRYFINSRGKKVLARHWLASNPVSNLIILPGYSEHSARYHPIANRFVDHGCNVFSMDYEGHGKSDGLKGDIREFSYHVDDVQQYLNAIREENEGPIWMLGHCMGGLVATQLAHRLQSKEMIQRLVLSAPLFSFGSEVPRIVQDTAKYVSSMAATFPILSVEEDWLSSDAHALENFREDELNYHGKLRARMASHLIQNGKDAREKLLELDNPVLLVHSQEDLFADPSFALELAKDEHEAPHLSVELLEKKGHMQLFESGWQDIIDQVIDWGNDLCCSPPVSSQVSKQ